MRFRSYSGAGELFIGSSAAGRAAHMPGWALLQRGKGHYGNSLMQFDYPGKKLGWTKKGMRITGTSYRDELAREQDGTCMKAT